MTRDEVDAGEYRQWSGFLHKMRLTDESANFARPIQIEMEQNEMSRIGMSQPENARTSEKLRAFRS